VGPRTGLDNVKRKFLTLLRLELRYLGRPARSQSLCRLGYPGSYKIVLGKVNLPVTVAERSKACTVFARSEAGTVGSNSTQGVDV
jgi:hypothetical protein